MSRSGLCGRLARLREYVPPSRRHPKVTFFNHLPIAFPMSQCTNSSNGSMPRDSGSRYLAGLTLLRRLARFPRVPLPIHCCQRVIKDQSACTPCPKQSASSVITKPRGAQIPVMLPEAWFKIRSFENAGRLWDVPSRLYQTALLHTVGRLNYFSERLIYKLSSRSQDAINQHIFHTKQHESFHVVTQALVTGLGVASIATGIPLLGGSSLVQVGIVVSLSGVFNVMSILHQRAQRAQCQRILKHLDKR